MRKETENIILNFARRSKGIIHGAKALNERLPRNLYKKTRDFDIYVAKAKVKAKELSEELNRASNRKSYEVMEGKHKGTYRVIYKPTKTSVADITSPKGKIPHDISLDKLRFIKIGLLKKRALKTLKNLEYSYRHKKDLATLKRIEMLESIKRKMGWEE